MSKRPPNKTVCRLVAKGFRAAIKKKGWSITRAATELGISRPSLYNYLNSKSLPGGEVLARAFDALDLSFTGHGLSLNKTNLSPQKKQTQKQVSQGELFKALAETTPEDVFETKLIRASGKIMEFRIKIKVAS